MVKLKSIVLHRAEGPTTDCGEVTVDSFFAAQTQLRRWSRTAPKGGGYDKVDVLIEWQDGSQYGLRYDMVRDCIDRDGRTLALDDEVRACLRFRAGRWCPPHMTQKKYQDYLAETNGDGQFAALCARLLDGDYEGVRPIRAAF